jgi:hypothetical protein
MLSQTTRTTHKNPLKSLSGRLTRLTVTNLRWREIQSVELGGQIQAQAGRLR